MRQVVVVTGASAGVGRATARAFAKRGADVALLARGRAGLDAAAREVEAFGRRALRAVVDVADAGAVEEAASEAEEELGPIDVWVNNAMTSVFSPLLEMSPEEFRRVTEVTYLGMVHGTMSALRRMMPRRRGVIVQVGSALAYRGIPLQSAYCGAKHAVQGFTESVRCELLHERSPVHITMVQLPALNTPQFDWVRSRLPRKARPVAPVYEPEVAAEAVVFASERRRREVWVGGSTAATILADRFASGALDLYLGRTGYDAQQSEEPEIPDRPSNLSQPVDENRDHGARGRFSEEAHDRSAQLSLVRHRTATVVSLVGLGVLVARAARRR